jgi:hypothetical protein
MEMGNFINTFVADSQAFTLAAIGGAAFLAVFSILYNRWMTDLGERKHGYTALLVALGNAVTLGVVAVISWKAALLGFIAFVVSGTAMIIGDIQRADKARQKTKKTARRKALPYAAAGLVDESIDLLTAADRNITRWLQNDASERQVALTALSVKDAIHKLTEARKVEGE